MKDFHHSPSIRQMMQAMGLKSPAPIQSRLKHLQQKGFISWQEGKARTLQILDDVLGGVPIMGSVAAGGLIETFSDIDEELDIDDTISHTAKNGYLDIKTRKERENAIKILLFLDVGGSMDDYIKQVENLFSAAKNVFKNLNFFYFHNCLYEGVWKSNVRRWKEQFSTTEIFRTYGKEYKCIFVGDASMSPYEILVEGGSNEHFNQETGQVWLERAIACLLYTSPSPRDRQKSRMPSSA